MRDEPLIARDSTLHIHDVYPMYDDSSGSAEM